MPPKKAAKKTTAETKTLVVKDPSKTLVWIYIVIDKRTGKVRYVGQTESIEGRWRNHAKKSSKCVRMRNEIRSVGSDMFEVRIVDDYAGGIPKSVAHLHEQYYMDHYCTIFNSQTAKHGLNMNPSPPSSTPRSPSTSRQPTSQEHSEGRPPSATWLRSSARRTRGCPGGTRRPGRWFVAWSTSSFPPWQSPRSWPPSTRRCRPLTISTAPSSCPTSTPSGTS